MSCQCRCCLDGKRCANELVLDAREVAILAKVNRVAGDGTGIRFPTTTVDRRHRSEPPEPIADVSCRSCRRTHPVFAYLAKFIADHAVTVHCEECR